MLSQIVLNRYADDVLTLAREGDYKHAGDLAARTARDLVTDGAVWRGLNVYDFTHETMRSTKAKHDLGMWERIAGEIQRAAVETKGA